MFSSRKYNSPTNKIHEKSLRSVNDDTGSIFQDLLKYSESVSVHNKNIQIVNTEVSKTLSCKNYCSTTDGLQQRFLEKD